ncbi:hypothetical protein [Acinetobacter venetianus]|uniref:hypothetical protein n=1 Tax=Acinetobacter venetianus TaxID=52133 RepID=UPI00036F4150|nr:hypothetical protein [Acinetobacter venetianus]
MSVIVNICGILAATANFPDQTLQDFYQQYYHCKIERRYDDSLTQIQSTQAIPHFFSKPPTWWPVFTSDQLQSESFQKLVEHGIKPGVILPNEYFSLIDYIRIKKAVSEGAIPVAYYQMKQSRYFASKATFSTAIGLRPLVAFVQTGWDENIISQPAGSYIIQSQDDDLNIPARAIQRKQQYFYNATTDATLSSGYQVIINPPENMSLNNIEYPQLGISWKIHNTKFQSTPERVKTTPSGYFLIVMSTVVIPLDYIFSARYPSLLSTFGSSISWISLLLGCTLLLILIMSIIRRRRINARN